MFFPERIKSIKDTDRVLEVGPGSMPFFRSDVFLEKIFDDEEAFKQRGFSDKLSTEKKVEYYHGGKFPFIDNEFDYVICSHVLEHVPENELELFINELQRVASKGYIEFPSVYYEVINYQDVHLWLMNLIDGKIIFLDKSYFKSNFIDQALRKLFYTDPEMPLNFSKYKELFFIGFEWNIKIDYQVADSLEYLNDFQINNWGNYFLKHKNQLVSKNSSYLKTILKKVFYKIKYLLKQKYKIARTAIIDNKNLVQLSENVEIQDYVIIKTYKNTISVGRNSQINPFTVIYGGAGVKIGDNVMIAPHCVIAAGSHDFIQVEKPMRLAGSFDKGPIVIENDVWIGANCTITDGVRIGRGAVIGANSVVTKNIEPYDIVGGCPTKKIKNRMDCKRNA